MQRAAHISALAAPRALAVAALLFALVWAQSAAAVHAGDHLFHDSDELCLAFHNVDKQPGVLGAAAAAPTGHDHAPRLGAAMPAAAGAMARSGQARAPPRG